MEKYREIERSIIKKYRKEIWSKFIKAIKDYELIQENDNIMVCISGGKDSFLLAKCIEELIKHGKFKFEAEYVVMNPGYNEYNLNTSLAFYALDKLDKNKVNDINEQMINNPNINVQELFNEMGIKLDQDFIDNSIESMNSYYQKHNKKVLI